MFRLMFRFLSIMRTKILHHFTYPTILCFQGYTSLAMLTSPYYLFLVFYILKWFVLSAFMGVKNDARITFILLVFTIHINPCINLYTMFTIYVNSCINLYILCSQSKSTPASTLTYLIYNEIYSIFFFHFQFLLNPK